MEEMNKAPGVTGGGEGRGTETERRNSRARNTKILDLSTCTQC